jgi:hypothetical protein
VLCAPLEKPEPPRNEPKNDPSQHLKNVRLDASTNSQRAKRQQRTNPFDSVSLGTETTTKQIQSFHWIRSEVLSALCRVCTVGIPIPCSGLYHRSPQSNSPPHSIPTTVPLDHGVSTSQSARKSRALRFQYCWKGTGATILRSQQNSGKMFGKRALSQRGAEAGGASGRRALFD